LAVTFEAVEIQNYLFGDPSWTLTFSEATGLPTECADKMQWSLEYGSNSIEEMVTIDWATRTLTFAQTDKEDEFWGKNVVYIVMKSPTGQYTRGNYIEIKINYQGYCEYPVSTVPQNFPMPDITYELGKEAITVTWDEFVTVPSDCAITYGVQPQIRKGLTVDFEKRTITIDGKESDREMIGSNKIDIWAHTPKGRRIQDSSGLIWVFAINTFHRCDTATITPTGTILDEFTYYLGTEMSLDMNALYTVEPAECAATIKWTYDFLPWNHAFMYEAIELSDNGLFTFNAGKSRTRYIKNSYQITAQPKTQADVDLPFKNEFELIVSNYESSPASLIFGG